MALDPADRSSSLRSVPVRLLGGLRRRVGLAFLVAGLAFLAFGLLSLNIVVLLSANLALLAEHGWTAVADGAALQLLELLASGYAALACFMLFKLCERVIVDWLHTVR